nr:MAG TPA: hypothetical protein [Caudoviricetes sp.]
MEAPETLASRRSGVRYNPVNSSNMLGGVAYAFLECILVSWSLSVLFV